MIRWTATAAVFAVSCGFVPVSTALDVPPELIQAKCATWENRARLTMEGRQEGESLSTAMAAASTDFDKKLVLKAHGEPRFQTEEKRQQAIKDFAEETYLYCYKILSM